MDGSNPSHNLEHSNSASFDLPKNKSQPLASNKIVINTKSTPEYSEIQKENAKRRVATPTFAIAKIPQIYNIEFDDEIDTDEIDMHSKLEVLEARLRSHRKKNTRPNTESVAFKFDENDKFVIQTDEYVYLQNYEVNFEKSTIPDFWSPRIYDSKEEKMTKNNSCKLKLNIKKAEKILINKPCNSEVYEEYRIFVGNAETCATFDALSGKEKLAIRKRKNFESRFSVTWDFSIDSTESSADETDMEDFIF